MWLIGLASAALAGAQGYASCCAATGTSVCPDTVLAIGPGTQSSTLPDGVQVTGLWELKCASGAFYDNAASQVIARSSQPGMILTPLMPAAAACFDAVCSLPPDLCVRYGSRGPVVVGCSSGQAPSDNAWRATATDDGSAVVVNGRVIKGLRSTGTSQRSAPALVHRPGGPPQTVYGTTARSAGGQVRGVGGISFEVPDPAPDPCRPSAAMRQPSNQQVDEGNEALVQNDMGTALNKYRAAITINQCNAFAWAALGDALLAVSRPGEARVALESATRLMPTHFRAWTGLGSAAEATGDRAAAQQAYQRALTEQPGYTPAAEGLRRMQ